jgi:ABC-type multidrug transport system fused ATPase/permease subunit
LLLLAIFGTLSALLVYLELFLATFVAQNLGARLREQLFDHLQRLSMDWHEKQKKGDLVQRVTGNIADIEKLVTDGLVDLLAGTLTLVGVAVIMLLISPEYTLLALAVAPVLFLLVSGYTGGIKAAARKKARAAGKIADVATEDINALAVIRAFTLEKRENLRFGLHVGTHREAGMRAGRLQAQFTPLVSVLVVLGTIIVVGVGGYVAAGYGFNLSIVAISASTIDVGTLVLFLTYLKMLYQPMRDLSKLATLASNGASGSERIQEVFDQAPEVVDTGIPYDGPQRLRGEISFGNVTFAYLKDRPVLKGISLHIPAGRRVALVGYSGSGKTTLAKLIPRFYQIDEGSLKIDGIDTRNYPLQVLRQNVSMVLQDSVLFEGTVRENIEIGRPGASLEEVIDAADKANIHEHIISMPGGYETIVCEQGNNFSAGQRQRLAIARAILRDSPILILDEPTANLDVEAEAEVMHALNTLIVGRTVLTISHRLSTLGHVDEIMVMHHGQIIERGTFKELKRKNGLFASLLEEQNRYNLDRDDGEDTLILSAFSTTTPLMSVSPLTDVTERLVAIPAHKASQTRKDSRVHLIPSHSSDLPHIMSAPAAPVLLPSFNGHTDKRPGHRHNRERSATQESDRVRKRKETNISIKAQVLVEMDGKVVEKYRLDKSMLTIGRFPTSDIQIPSQRVSRFHALIHWQDARWVIEDAESLNGLSYQGQRIDKIALLNGDRISIDSSIVLQYEELP